MDGCLVTDGVNGGNGMDGKDGVDGGAADEPEGERGGGMGRGYCGQGAGRKGEGKKRKR